MGHSKGVLQSCAASLPASAARVRACTFDAPCSRYTAPRPGNSNACASREYPAAQRPLHCVNARTHIFGLSIGRNINAVIIPFLMIVGGARHEPIHRMHGMSLSTHPCQRHSVACGCDVVAVAPCLCSLLGRHQRLTGRHQRLRPRACPASRSRPACHQPSLQRRGARAHGPYFRQGLGSWLPHL